MPHGHRCRRRARSLIERCDRRAWEAKRIAFETADGLRRKRMEIDAMVRSLEHLAADCRGDERPDCPIIDDMADHIRKQPAAPDNRSRPKTVMQETDMRPFPHSISRCRFALVLALGAGLAACSASSPNKDAGLLGYGTPGVSSYVENGRDSTLQAELERCRGVGPSLAPGQTRSLEAACNQLRRTVRNQPGNAVRPTPAP